MSDTSIRRAVHSKNRRIRRKAWSALWRKHGSAAFASAETSERGGRAITEGWLWLRKRESDAWYAVQRRNGKGAP